MEYYQDLCLTTDHHQLLNVSYTPEFTPQYLQLNHEAEYAVRSSVLVDGGDRFGVSSVAFDKFEELIWMGNQGGHVTSYYGPAMQKYTSFQIHDSEEVRDILSMERGIFALTKTSLRHQIRRGIPKFTHRSQNMTDMQCLYQVNDTKLLIGGHQDKLIDYDLTKGVEAVIRIDEEGCAVIRSGGGSTVACGSANGMVALRDLRSPSAAKQTFQAHTACLSDLDMQGNLLITCGFTQSDDVPVAEPYIVVWDIRCLRRNTSGEQEGAWSIPIDSPPLLLQFLPAFSGRAVTLSRDGLVALLHVNTSDVNNQSVFQVDTQSAVCSVMDVSPTSQALVFGDQAGHLHLFSPQHNHEPVFNNFSRATEFADSVVELPFVDIKDETFRFSSVPFTQELASGTRWFNELPEEFYKKVYRKPRPIDPEVLKSMKMQGPIGYAPNPGTFKRNQIPYMEDSFEDLQVSKLNDSKYILQPVPKMYQKLDLRFNKHNEILEDLESYNKAGLPGLEATLPNSYCNCMLQVLYHTPLVKATLLAHNCAKEFCLSCELGYLFRTLDASRGAACQAAGFLRAFRTVPEAAALGLLVPERGPDARVDYVGLIQSWNRFILHHIHYEIFDARKQGKLVQNPSPSKARVSKLSYGEDYQYPACDVGDGVPNPEQMQNHESRANAMDKEDSEISQLFAIGRHQLNRCLKCNKEEERDSVVLACALQYPTSRQSWHRFSSLLAFSLSSARSSPAWCARCGKFTHTHIHTTVVRLPPILAINCGGVTAHEKAYWAKGTQKDGSDVCKRGGSGKPCRYGLQCARPGCRFKHPDRMSPQGSSRSPVENNCVLPNQLIIKLQSDGDVIINEKNDPPSEPHTPKSEQNNKKKPSTTQTEEYALSACVVCVDDNPKNLIAYVKVADDQWYLINDLTICAVSTEEVVQFGAWWKSPCVLFYTSEAARRAPGGAAS